MTVPNEFLQFAASFYQGSREDSVNTEDWIDGRIKMLAKGPRKTVEQYIAGLLQTAASEKVLGELWASGDPAYGPNDSDVRGFFGLLLDRLQKAP